MEIKQKSMKLRKKNSEKINEKRIGTLKKSIIGKLSKTERDQKRKDTNYQYQK